MKSVSEWRRRMAGLADVAAPASGTGISTGDDVATLQSGLPCPSWPTGDPCLPGPAGLAGQPAPNVDPAIHAAQPVDPGTYSLDEWLRRSMLAVLAAIPNIEAKGRAGIPIGRQAMFILVRWTKGHPLLIKSSADSAWPALAEARPDWLTEFIDAVARRSGSCGERINIEEVRESFAACWDAVRIPVGWDAITVALRQAESCPLPLDDLWPADRHVLRLATSALGWLQAFQPAAAICFARVPWSRHLELSPRAVTDLARAMLQADVIREVRGGFWERSRAIDYRFNLAAFPSLHEASGSELAAASAAFARLPRYEREEKPRVRARGRLIAAACQTLIAKPQVAAAAPPAPGLAEPT